MVDEGKTLMSHQTRIRSCLSVLLVTLVLASASQVLAIPAVGTVEAFFSPDGGCEQAIVKEIDYAKSEIQVQVYSFTNVPIAKALLAAHKRGVKIEALLDKSQRSEKYTAATFLNNVGIPVLIDDSHKIAHNKIIIIDRSTLITGSFNFSKSAEHQNAENLLVLKGNQALTDRYIQNYNDHKSHGVPYEFTPKSGKDRRK